MLNINSELQRIQNETNQWVRDILNQKNLQKVSINRAAITGSASAEVSTINPEPMIKDYIDPPSSDSERDLSQLDEPPEPPEPPDPPDPPDLPTIQIDICVNGSPTTATIYGRFNN